MHITTYGRELRSTQPCLSSIPDPCLASGFFVKPRSNLVVELETYIEPVIDL